MLTKDLDCDDVLQRNILCNEGWRVGQIKRVIVNDIGGHEFIDVNLFPGVNLITGGNGSGKSSLVSAIALLCGWSGRKAGKDANLNKYVRIGANKGVVRIHFANNDSELQRGYLNDIYGEEIIIERIIYLKGNSNYTFKGSKSSSPIHRSFNAKNHLSQFRAYANIMINNPVTFLTQMDAKYLIREQNSPKNLYDFFQRAHLFDCSWKHLAEEQSRIERAEVISKSLNNELKQLESELEEFKNVNELMQIYNKLQTYQKNLESINIVASIENLNSSINCLLFQSKELTKTKSALEIEELNKRILESEREIDASQSELNNLHSEYEINFNEHKKLNLELGQISDKFISYSKQMKELKSEISSLEKEIEYKREDHYSNEEKKKLDYKEEILKEIKAYKEKANILNSRKENLILLSIDKKNKLSTLFEKIKENDAEINLLSDEKLTFNLKLDEIKNILEIDKKSLEYDYDLSESNKFNATETGHITDLSSKINDFKVKESLAVKYSRLYDYFTDEDFEIIFGYSKFVHNKIIKQLEEIDNKVNVIGPIALHIFSKPDFYNNEKIISMLDEIIGGRFEGHDIISGYKIRRNYKYWLVENSKTRKELVTLFKDHSIFLDPSLIYIRSPFSQKYELSGVRKKFPEVGLAVVDLINIENDEVFNFLVDNFQIETTFIFLNDQEMDLIYDYSFNIRRAHCLANYSFKYRRGGIVVSPEVFIPKQHTPSKIVIRKLMNTLKLRKYESNLCSLSKEEKKCDLTEKIEMKRLLKLNIKENENKKEEIIRKIADIEKKNKDLELSITNNNNKARYLRNQISSFEIELDDITKEEHIINVKIGEFEIELRKLNRDQNHIFSTNISEISNLSTKLSELNILLADIQEKINNEEKLKIIKNADLEKLKIILEHKKNLIKIKEQKHKNLKMNNNSLLNDKPKIEKKFNQITDKINQLNTEIDSKKNELANLKIKYRMMNTKSCTIEESDIGADLLMSSDLLSTLKYFNWNLNISEKAIKSFPDNPTIELWKLNISRKIDTIYLEIIEKSKIFGFNSFQKNCSENLFDKILETMNVKSREYKEKINELKEENKLLIKNKTNLNKRIQRLQKDHIRCGKNVNSQFKHYFSIFWSNTIRPHLKFDHDKSILNIYVIPDTAVVKKPKQVESHLSFESSVSRKDQLNNFVSREIQSLSGGESSSIGISFLLALSQNNSSPFHLFDEPDVYMDDIRRMTTIQSLIEFERLCSRGKITFNRQVLFITPHSEIVPHIKENYADKIHVIQLIKR
ncbi:Smc ABC ATpase [Cryptosporidium sp. chipmunk genotype I]|uniref:Smc ABC ATpase n=1 Tax=Cryptosporidium sp. chipmunk genotype I TaxID=1280935 RepID=UPI003519DB50|nr:Smc ABC ATpase [Cryptosporidium sp. chipmunk genotype I]